MVGQGPDDMHEDNLSFELPGHHGRVVYGQVRMGRKVGRNQDLFDPLSLFLSFHKGACLSRYEVTQKMRQKRTAEIE
jgi:hypothetical protein